ncbi:MAG: membrane protein insertion efficiency factor YidD [Candidatus Melainabacteria bacterium]|nr:membrane protein insertion efficiency factor YidD [Candidatus Melainabacteria bacterium]
MKKILVAIIVLYQATRPLRKNTCRFYPSCSTFLKGCIQTHGVCRGIILGTLRLLRCHPFHPGGVDEVPKEFSWRVLNCCKLDWCTTGLHNKRG